MKIAIGANFILLNVVWLYVNVLGC